MARTFDAAAPEFEKSFSRFLREQRATGHDVAGIVAKILDDVDEKGGVAVADYTSRFDELQIDPTTLQSDNVDLHLLASECPADLKEAIDFAHDRIAAYHLAQKPADHSFTDEAGVELGWRWTALDSVGVYVPGGRASYPSSVLMNVVPARMAGSVEGEDPVVADRGQVRVVGRQRLGPPGESALGVPAVEILGAVGVPVGRRGAVDDDKVDVSAGKHGVMLAPGAQAVGFMRLNARQMKSPARGGARGWRRGRVRWRWRARRAGT